jgi:hypothetical protein
LFAKSQFFDNVKKSLTLVSLLYNDSWDEWIRLDCLLKHSDENIEKQKEQGLKQQGIKSAMAWKVSKMKPRSPNGQSASSFVCFAYSCLDGYLAAFVDIQSLYQGLSFGLACFILCRLSRSC